MHRGLGCGAEFGQRPREKHTDGEKRGTSSEGAIQAAEKRHRKVTLRNNVITVNQGCQSSIHSVPRP
jgi:hypothetical protein